MIFLPLIKYILSLFSQKKKIIISLYIFVHIVQMETPGTKKLLFSHIVNRRNCLLSPSPMFSTVDHRIGLHCSSVSLMLSFGIVRLNDQSWRCLGCKC